MGATGVNGSYVPGANGSVQGAGDPVSFFPSFAGPSGSFWADQVGTLRHGGIWTLFEWWGQGAAHLPSGIQSGPLYTFNTSFAPAVGAPPGAPSKPATAIFSPLDHFHLTPGGVVQDRGTAFGKRTGFGLASTVIDVPPGYRTSVGVFAGSGITQTAYAWGALMQQRYGTQRLVGSANLPRSALTEKVSYFTDNGAVHFQSWWDTHCPGRNCTLENSPQELLVALKRSFSQPGQEIPFGIYQLDTWWFYQMGDVVPGGNYDCVDWRARPDMWPNGIPWVTQQEGGIPLMLYSWGYVPPANGNRMTNFSWESSLYFGAPLLEAQPELDQVYAFYSEIRDRFLGYNGTSFEEDNMGTMTMSYQSHITAVDGVERWWSGFASPWCESEIPVQICESNAADILESLKYGCVTTSRDNIDDVPGADASTFVSRWHVGFDRLFISAMGLQPFFDNVWSKPSMPGSTWDPNTEQYVELAFVLSVLSAGPVGIGDELSAPGTLENTNRSLVMACCAADGTLLKPSTPSTYLDLVYLPPALNPIRNVALGRIFQSVSYIPEAPAGRSSPAVHSAGMSGTTASAPYFGLLSVDVANDVGILPSYLTPDVSAGAVSHSRRSSPLATAARGKSVLSANVSGYVGVPWNPGFDAVSAACADGQPGAGCVFPFSDTAPLTVNTGLPAGNNNLTHNWDYATLSPLYTCPGYDAGYALLGELGKVVRVSPVRFSFAVATCDASSSLPQLTFAIAGPPGELVSVAVLAPTIATTGAGSSGTLWNVPVTLPAQGGATVVCTGAGDKGSPCSVSS